VLDVGCGVGKVALAVAEFVDDVHGLDIRGERIQSAVQLAAERGISNASFEVCSIEDYRFAPESWDVTMFMRVWGRDEGRRQVGREDLENVLLATRRQVIIQAGKPRSEHNVRRVMEICGENGFDAGWFVSQKLIVANRRETDARISVPPERVLVASSKAPALVPATAAPNHPMLESIDPGLRAAV
jgi:SAM-dependent methyltransferase